MPIEIGNDTRLHIIKTDKFKTNLVSVYIKRPLDKDEVTKNALLSMVLPRGTKNYPTSMELAKTMESLYGAYLGSDVSKKGERNILQFRLQLVNDKYVDEKNVLVKGMKMLNELIHEPFLEGGCFKDEYVNQEKNNLMEKIEGRKNDKMKYAYDRCIEEMCKHEKFSLYEYGNLEGLKDINSRNLYDHYQHIIGTSPVDICIVGDFDEKEIEALVAENLKFDQRDITHVGREKIDFMTDHVNVIHEEMNINQGKLSLGYRTNIPFESELYHPLVVYSNILGGGPNSKLFKNVREKESLCYYIFSRVEKFKSLMMIGSGIEFANYDKAVALMKEQMTKMNQGDFTGEDIDSAKSSIITSIQSMTDSPSMLADYYYTQAISNNYDTFEEIMGKIRAVDKSKIMEAGKRITLDTIYFLKGKKEGI